MRICQIGFAIISGIFLAGCNPSERLVYVVPDVPKTLRTPVTVPERKAETLADVGLILTDHVEGLQIANGRIAGIDCILSASEDGADASECLEAAK